MLYATMLSVFRYFITMLRHATLIVAALLMPHAPCRHACRGAFYAMLARCVMLPALPCFIRDAQRRHAAFIARYSV